jgi:hypothetical protein
MSAMSMLYPVAVIPAAISTPVKTTTAKPAKIAHDHWLLPPGAGWA